MKSLRQISAKKKKKRTPKTQCPKMLFSCHWLLLTLVAQWHCDSCASVVSWSVKNKPLKTAFSLNIAPNFSFKLPHRHLTCNMRTSKLAHSRNFVPVYRTECTETFCFHRNLSFSECIFCVLGLFGTWSLKCNQQVRILKITAKATLKY